MLVDSEVLIVGGSHSGLSAAMALGRMMRTALVCDTGEPRNKVSNHANNLISQDGLNPETWRASARRDLSKYKTIDFLNAAVTSIAKKDGSFEAEFTSGPARRFKKVILAYGVKDRLPAVDGFRELWGKSVFHCPFCHGYEFASRRIGFVGSAKFAEHMVPMLRGLTKDIVLFTNGETEISTEFSALLQRNEVPVVTDRISALNHDGSSLHSVVVGQREVARDALLVAPIGPIEFSSKLSDQLGCERTELGFIKIIEMGKTSVDGVFAAGDIITPMHSVLNAAMSGQVAGARAVMELLNESFHAR